MTEYWDKYGRSPDKKSILAIGLPSAGKDTGGYTFTETVFENYCPKCKKKGTLMWGIFYGGSFNGRGEGGSSEGHIFCDGTLGGCDADFSVQGWEHISGSNACCKVIVKTKKSSKSRALSLKEGKLPYEGSSTTNEGSNNASAGGEIKSAIKEVLYNWDGDVECFIRDDTVYIKKIPSPTDAKLSLVEGVNIDLGSVSVTDYNPSTINILTTSFEDYDLTIQDDYLIKRFGKIPSNVSIDDSIENLNDAKKFLQREWNKLKRENGHSLELKTYGDSNWGQGEWCRVYLPSFNIDDYMYITKVSQEDSGEWNCNLTLVDYPPGFGEPSKTGNEEENESEDTNDANENTIDTQTGEDIT